MSSHKPPLILIVDDDIITNHMIKSILMKAGFSTLSSFDAAGALSSIFEHRPDLVLLDVNLPDGNGLEVCSRIQRESGSAKPPVLFISSDEDVSTKVKGFEAGGVDYITKPLAGAEVIARVSTHLRLKQAYETLSELQAERIKRLAVAQETLMPQPADLPDARFYVSLNQILQAGGDFYDVLPVGNQMVDYLVADASGHDLAASFWTASLKTLVTEYANPANTPRDILYYINSALCKILPSGVFFTLIYARLNRQTRKLTLVNAGHPPAIVIPKGGKESIAVYQEGDVLGSFQDAVFNITELQLSAGSRFFLYSDGLIETSGTHDDNIRKIIETGSSLEGASMEDTVNSIVRKVTGDHEVQDDILLMGVEV